MASVTWTLAGLGQEAFSNSLGFMTGLLPGVEVTVREERL